MPASNNMKHEGKNRRKKNKTKGTTNKKELRSVNAKAKKHQIEPETLAPGAAGDVITCNSRAIFSSNNRSNQKEQNYFTDAFNTEARQRISTKLFENRNHNVDKSKDTQEESMMVMLKKKYQVFDEKNYKKSMINEENSANCKSLMKKISKQIYGQELENANPQCTHLDGNSFQQYDGYAWDEVSISNCSIKSDVHFIHDKSEIKFQIIARFKSHHAFVASNRNAKRNFGFLLRI